MNYLKIFLFTYILNVTPIIVCINNFNEELMDDIFTPLELEISLDFLKMQINKEQYTLKNDWESPATKSILNKAEILVKNSPKNLKEKIKIKIINFFKEIDIDIIFTEDNLIVKHDTKGTNFTILQNNNEKHAEEQRYLETQADQQKKYLLKHKDTGYKPTQPKKIKGARKTMNRLKKRYADEKKTEEKHHKDMVEALHEYTKKQLEKIAKENKNKTSQEKNIFYPQDENQEHETNRVHTKNIKSHTFTTKKQPKPNRPVEHTENVHTFDINPGLN